MNIVVLGVNFKSTPIEIREKFNIPQEERESLSKSILNHGSISEVITIFTCNRTEVYACTNMEDASIDILSQSLCEYAKMPLAEMKKYFYFYIGRNAAKHLFEVASGMDSMLIGEDQILKQVKDSANTSYTNHFCGKILNTLFRYSITSAKRIKTQTAISSNMTSLSSLGAKIAQDFFEGDLANRTALVIGIGKAGSSAIKHLLTRNIQKIYVTNRSHEKAVALTSSNEKLNFVDYQNRYEMIREVDIVISCTSSPHYTITKDKLEASLEATCTQKKLFIDLAVPRDIDPDIGQIPFINYRNVDSLGEIAQSNLCKRKKDTLAAQSIIDGYVEDFEKWYTSRKSVHLLKKVNAVSEILVKERLSKVRGKLGKIEKEELLSKAIHATAKDFLNAFVYSVKENCTVEEIETFYNIMDNAFTESRFRKLSQ